MYNFPVARRHRGWNCLNRPLHAGRAAFAAALSVFSTITLYALPAAAEPVFLSKIEIRSGAASDFAVLGDGSIVVSNLDDNALYIYSPAGNMIRSLRPPVDSGDFFRPGAIALEGEERFWVVDSFSGRVLRYLNDGNMVSSFPLAIGSTGLHSIAAIAVQPPRRAPKVAVGHTTGEGESPESFALVDHADGNSDSIGDSGGLFVLRADGVISVFSLSGKHDYNLPVPARLAVPTPAGLYLDYPLVWSLDYESKRISIYDLERRESPPGVVPLKGIPAGAPICGLAGVPGETLIVVLSGGQPVWAESDDGWINLVSRKAAGSQPPIVKLARGKLYLLDRDAGQIEIYSLN